MLNEKLATARKFMRKHKKSLLIISSILATSALAIVGCNVLKQSGSDPYTTQWLKGLSDDELPEEHERARLAMRDAHNDWDLACKMDFWRRKISDEIELRKDDGTDNHTFPPAREDGYNLYRPE